VISIWESTIGELSVVFYSKRSPAGCKLRKVQKICRDFEESAYAARVNDACWTAFAARVGGCVVWWVRRDGNFPSFVKQISLHFVFSNLRNTFDLNRSSMLWSRFPGTDS
jgi:hypothetical protein